MSIVDDYILQHFPAKDSGNPETDDAYRARQCWIKHNYPPIKDVDKLCNLQKGRAKQYSHKYGWKDIRAKISELEAEQDLIKLREQQKNTEKKHTKRNDVLGSAYERRLQKLLEDVGEIETTREIPEYTEKEIDEKWDKILELGQRISVVQKDERTTAHLPNNYKDITGDLKVQSENTNLNTNLNIPIKSTSEVLDENADTITRFIERRMHTSDTDTS